MAYKIGIDVGGTNTDAVLLDNRLKLKASAKVSTSPDLLTGIENAIEALKPEFTKELPIDRILLGTTLATNAILEAKNLSRVGLIRLAGHQPDTIQPTFGWPDHLKKIIFSGCETVSGGYECDGRFIKKLNYDEIMKSAEKLIKTGAEAIGILGVFSFLYPEQELKAIEWLKKEYGNAFPVQSSYEFGGSGFIERENTLLLNLALQKTFKTAFQGLSRAIKKYKAPFWMVQNNGTIIPVEEAIAFPIRTIAAGPTNSFIGAAKLANLSDAVVIDMGGTSTDIGVVQGGLPRRSLNNIHIGGVSISFAAPDIMSRALGGGSIIRAINQEQFQIGPESVGNQLWKKSKSFNGDTLTLTDAAILLAENLSGKTKHLSCKTNQTKTKLFSKTGLTYEQANSLLKQALNEIAGICQKMVSSNQKTHFIFVGGGASLFPKAILPENWIIPQYSNVANAYGAALAEVSATTDQVVSFKEGRNDVLDALTEDIFNKAIRNGALNPKIIEQHIFPYHYLPGQMARVVLTAAGMGRGSSLDF